MAYGTVKVDNITFTNGGIDQTVTVSGIVQSISGNITATGTIQGETIIGTSTVSGATVTGDVGVFTTVTGGFAGFTTVTGTTVTGTTANFVNGTFSTQVSGTTVRGTTVSGATVTGAIGQFTTLTGGTAGFTTVTGTTVTGTTANFQSGVFTTQISGATVTGNVGSFSTITGGTVTLTSGVFGTGTAAAPSIAFTGDSNTGIYSPGADQVAVATNGAQRLLIDSSGQIESAGLGTAAAPAWSFVSDPNTGIYSPGADQLALSTNGTGRLFVGANPHVGVGITPNASSASSQVLEVGPSTFSSIGNDCYQGANWFYTGAAYVYKNSAAASQYIQGGGAHIWTTASSGTAGNAITFSERLRITSAGLVGIGTSSPISLIEAKGNQPQITLNTTVTGYPGLVFQTNGTSDGGIYYNSIGDKLEFYTADTAGDPQAVIDASGRLGIGTSTVSQKLHLYDSSNNTYMRAAVGANTGVDFGAAADGNGVINVRDNAALQVLTNGSERCRLDASGRLLVGTSSTSSNAIAIIQGESSISSAARLYLTRRNTASAASDELGVLHFSDSNHGSSAEIKARRDGGTWTPGVSLPSRLEFSTTADGASSPTERMRITSDGFVGIGATSPSARLTVLSPDIIGGVGTASTIAIPASNGVAPLLINFNSIATNSTQPLRFGVGTTERVRIGTTGNVSSFSDSGESYTIRTGSTAGTTDKFIAGVYSASSPISGGIVSIYIYTNGNVVNTNNSYGAISDIKLKENIVDASSQWDDLKALQVRKYNFKEGQTHAQIGLVAQEVELVSPGLVTESPDRDEEGNDLGTVTKSVNYSVLYMKAVKALQESMERIEVLEQRLNDAGIN